MGVAGLEAYTIEKKDRGYLLFTITRDEKRNAIDYEVMQGLLEVIEQAKKPEIKALVITGSGLRAFCSGGDLAVFHALSTHEEAYKMLSKMSEILYSLLVLPKPVLGLINGPAVGGGCEILAACDFRIARSGIKAGFVQGKQAITTGWGGGTILAEKLSASKAMKLLMEAELKPVEELKAEGFIDEVFKGDPLSACESFLDKVVSLDSSVLQSYKNILIRKWEDAKLSERMEAEVQNCSYLWESDAHHLYVNSFLNKN
jgi:enoyl-CoA hydratase/carnithine racemase